VIGRDCVILDGSVVGAGVVLEPGSVVFPRSTLEAGKVYAGKPAKPVGDATADERATRAAAIRADRDTSWRPPCEAPPAIERHPSAYIASTARVSGAVRMAAGTSLWFGCAVDARGGPVVIGENTNVQDNTRIVTTTARGVRIGRETTIGHNVLIEDCEIGERCLIGIGAHVASGTVIEPGVLLAGGAVTAPGQVLTADAVWGGTPARKLSAMDAARHDTTARIVQGYCAYARAYAEVPAAVFAG
jgi:carbonic anhydrase/acetyltransferase-like protein (isoleucine patch superfamily)